MKDGVEMARDAIASGLAAEKINDWVALRITSNKYVRKILCLIHPQLKKNYWS